MLMFDASENFPIIGVLRGNLKILNQTSIESYLILKVLLKE